MDVEGNCPIFIGHGSEGQEGTGTADMPTRKIMPDEVSRAGWM